MNEDQTMFAEMLGIRKPAAEMDVRDAQSSVVEENAVDELDVQKEVVQEIAREKAEMEELRDRLESERQRLAMEKAELESKNAELVRECEELKADLEKSRADHAVLEEKLARMGRALMAARRAAAEAAKVVIGGRKW